MFQMLFGAGVPITPRPPTVASEMAAKKKVKKAMHMMPNGKMMKGKAHEKNESKMEKKAEYGPKPKKK